MRLESRKCIGNGSTRLQSLRSSSIDSNDDDNRIRLDDPSLRLTIDSPHLLQTDPIEPNNYENSFKEHDKNMNTTQYNNNAIDARQQQQHHHQQQQHISKNASSNV